MRNFKQIRRQLFSPSKSTLTILKCYITNGNFVPCFMLMRSLFIFFFFLHFMEEVFFHEKFNEPSLTARPLLQSRES